MLTEKASQRRNKQTHMHAHTPIELNQKKKKNMKTKNKKKATAATSNKADINVSQIKDSLSIASYFKQGIAISILFRFP